MIQALADAFAHEEARDARVYEVRASPDMFKVIATFDTYERESSGKGELWNATFILDKKLRKGMIVLRYKRAVTLPGPKPTAANYWAKREKLKRYRKKVHLPSLVRPDPPSREPLETA